MKLVRIASILVLALLALALTPARAYQEIVRYDGDGAIHNEYKPIMPTDENNDDPTSGVVVDGRVVLADMPAELREALSKDVPVPPHSMALRPAASVSAPGYAGFQYGSTVTGMTGDFSALLSMNLSETTPPENPLVHPTTMRSYKSCLEMGTTAWRSPYGYMLRYFEAYDWCGPGAGGDGTGGWQDFIDTSNATWRSKYTVVASFPSPTQVGVFFDDKTIHPRLFPTGASPNCAGVDLWNYQTGAWDAFSRSCGTDTSSFPQGWMVWETHAWDAAPYPICEPTLGFYNVAQSVQVAVRYASGTWGPSQTTDVSNTYDPNGVPAGVNCLDDVATADYFSVLTWPGWPINGRNLVVCGPVPTRTLVNPKCV